MKKKISKLIFVLSIIFSLIVFQGVSADEYSLFGGMKREETLKKGVYYYEEICFMSGEAVLLKGTVTIPEIPENSMNYKISVDYNAESKTKNIQLSRSVTYNVEKNKDNEMGQVITNWVIPEGGLSETVKIGGKTYSLTRFKFDNSRITDVKAGINFTSSNVLYEKVFHTDGDLSESGSRITMRAETGTDLAYSNYWSKSGSRVINVDIEYDELSPESLPEKQGASGTNEKANDSNSWRGQVMYKTSTLTKCNFENVVNNVKSISFKNGLLKSENTEELLTYSYDLPSFDKGNSEENDSSNNGNNGEDSSDSASADLKAEKAHDDPVINPLKRNKGEGMLNAYVYEKSSRLPVPKYVDIGNHWAEEEIFRMASVESFEMDKAFFPDDYITRAQFARAIVNAITHVSTESEELRRKELIKSKRKGYKGIMFEDVARDDRYYIFIAKAFEDDIMVGEGNKQFLPNRPLTRCEAITVMMRSLGIVDTAPVMPFDSGFSDDRNIPSWAKPSMYIAKYIGVVEGYEDGSAQPLKHLTRAETAALLSRLVDHLRDDITLDYREKLLEDY